MRPSCVVALWLAAGVAAQGQRAELLDIGDVVTRLAGKDDEAAVVAQFGRLQDLLARQFPAAERAAVRIRGLIDHRRLMCIGTADQLAAVRASLARLRPEAPPAVLQVTIATAPWTVAVAHRLADGKASPIEVGAAGQLLKDVASANGAIRNLPEWSLPPVVPVPLAAPGKPPGEELQLSVLPVGEQNQLVVLQLPAKASGPGASSEPIAKGLSSEIVLRPDPATGAILVLRDGAEATFFWVRLAAPAPGPAATGAEPSGSAGR